MPFTNPDEPHRVIYADDEPIPELELKSAEPTAMPGVAGPDAPDVDQAPAPDGPISKPRPGGA